MSIKAGDILAVLDRCCDQFTFPMLDNGYVYLAATRLSLYRTDLDWAMVIKVFGFSPRSGMPDTHIYTFASRLNDRDEHDGYQTREAYERYLEENPNNDSRFIEPIGEGDWQDGENPEIVASNATQIPIRGVMRPIPSVEDYFRQGILLEDPSQVRTFELCRFLAQTARDSVLATDQERRISVLPEMTKLLQLEEWHHPNVVEEEERPSGSETFQQLAQVLVTGNVALYKPSKLPNTDWRNWPDGGTL